LHYYWTYILASRPRGTLYIGVTNGLPFRVRQHREGRGSKFVDRYKVHRLVWFEEFADIELAIQREKSLKRYPRAWKINLIESTNLHWIDLFPSLPAYRTPTDVEHAPGLDPRHKAEDDT